MNVTYLSRSTNVMFSAISATRLAIREAIIVYGDMLGLAPLGAPLVAGAAFLVTVPVAFLVRDAGARLVVRFTGAEATEAAGIFDMRVRKFGVWYVSSRRQLWDSSQVRVARVQVWAYVEGPDSDRGMCSRCLGVKY